ncbi:hypothetical protein F4782DRAFT_551818 [Xylaria castorea]|nr:hypothetical protein F4782DRAFT_551818 [Xylaria castorea]
MPRETAGKGSARSGDGILAGTELRSRGEANARIISAASVLLEARKREAGMADMSYFWSTNSANLGINRRAPPVHSFRPLVTTGLIEDIMSEETSGIPDNLPGEDLMVCFANFNDNYEDSIIFSKGAASRGLFNYMAYSARLINSSEKAPEVGQRANMRENRWWKVFGGTKGARHYSYAGRGRMHRVPQPSGRPIGTRPDGTGVVVSKMDTASGQVSVKMLRFSCPIQGDKVATGHGQKGVMKLWDEEDMPWGLDDHGNVVRFDMVVALSSITNRLAVGQYYEMVSGRSLIVKPYDSHGDHMETVLYDGASGQMIERRSEGPSDLSFAQYGDSIPVLASWGICRVWQMTQLTWDKHHYTHNTAGQFATTTPTGRTAGSRIRLGEMESHARSPQALSIR